MEKEVKCETDVPLDEIIDIVKTDSRIFIYSTNPNLSKEEVGRIINLDAGYFNLRYFKTYLAAEMIIEKASYVYMIEVK